MVTEKAMRQFNNHDGEFCLDLGKDEWMSDYLLDEIIHFLFFHMWWNEPTIMKEITKKRGLDRKLRILEVIKRPYNCHHSQGYDCNIYRRRKSERPQG